MTKGTFDKEALRAAYDRLRDASNGRPFDPDTAWRQIELVAISCRAHEDTKPLIWKPADFRDHFTGLERALFAARHELKKTLSSVQRAGQLRDACRQNGIEPGSIANVLESIATLERAAHEAGEKNSRKPGRPEGSEAPPHAVEQLEMVYRNTTGRKPTATREGPFAQFVYECLAGFGYTLRDDAVYKLIKKARQRRPAAT